MSDCTCPNHSLERCQPYFNRFFNKLQLKFGHAKMMGNVVLISFNSSPSTKLNININWSLLSYCINFSTFVSLPQWVSNLWLFFTINAMNFNVAWEVGKKCEHVTYYGVPSFNYLNLTSIWLLLTIIIWEVGVVGEGSQGVWTTSLVQCPNIL
jgi:hypothetical protein